MESCFELRHVPALKSRINPRRRFWGFFESREQLAAYLHWMDTPQTQGPQVVKLVPKKPVT